MDKITIEPHGCSREEYEELIKYLDDQCWDYRKIKVDTREMASFLLTAVEDVDRILRKCEPGFEKTSLRAIEEILDQMYSKNNYKFKRKKL